MDVEIRCTCPPTADGEPRHETDTVTLRDKLDPTRALTVRKAVGFIDNDDRESRGAEVLATLSLHYLMVGVERWSLADDSGPIPVTQKAIRERLFESPELDVLVEAADALYNEAVLLPLVARAARSSPPMPTAASTSATTSGSTKRPTPSPRSSTSTSLTVVTAATTTSRGGVSNSSPSSATGGRLGSKSQERMAG